MCYVIAHHIQAYVFELDDEYAESDIPTTLLRSKADCPTQEVTTLSTNDIVINKLTQILSYLRQGARTGKKGKRKDKGLLPCKLWDLWKREGVTLSVQEWQNIKLESLVSL